MRLPKTMVEAHALCEIKIVLDLEQVSAMFYDLLPLLLIPVVAGIAIICCLMKDGKHPVGPGTRRGHWRG
jgi:hypothetical protein